MKKIFSILVLLVFAFGVDAAFADVDIELSCPGSVTAGTALNVTVYLQNHDCQRQKVKRFMVGITGNYDRSLGGVGIWGPFKRDAGFYVPGASCGSQSWVAGKRNRQIKVTGKMPLALKGTVAQVFVIAEVKDGVSTDSEGEMCWVEVK